MSDKKETFEARKERYQREDAEAERKAAKLRRKNGAKPSPRRLAEQLEKAFESYQGGSIPRADFLFLQSLAKPDTLSIRVERGANYLSAARKIVRLVREAGCTAGIQIRHDPFHGA